jgi:pimeloyl-ACP methyl ester carboxylesterase
VVAQIDVPTSDGRRLRAYDTGQAGRRTVVWHHGTPNLGTPPQPLFPAADRLGIRWVSYDRPGYGGSTALPGRDLASAADDVTAVADALGIDRFAVMGHSGGSSFALAVAALLPDRVLGAVSMAALAPLEATGLDWYAGMCPSGEASLRAAAAGPAEKERYESSGVDYDPEFTTADLALLGGDWAWLGRVVGAASAEGPGGLIADDLSYVAPWRFSPTDITAPTLLLHGGRDRVVPDSHSRWLARHIPAAQLRLYPDDGHVSILAYAEQALEFLASR